VIYEAVSRDTGRVVAAFSAKDDEYAGARLRFDIENLDWLPEWARQLIPQPERIKLRRAPDPATYPHIKPAMFDWLPKRVSNG
jgi:hypothetical protein